MEILKKLFVFSDFEVLFWMFFGLAFITLIAILLLGKIFFVFALFGMLLVFLKVI